MKAPDPCGREPLFLAEEVWLPYYAADCRIENGEGLTTPKFLHPR